MRKAAVLVLGWLLLAAAAYGQTPKPPVNFNVNRVAIWLQWDPNTETDLAGYKLYFGNKPRTYGTPVDMGKVTTYPVSGLAEGTWFFAVTAYNTSGVESGFSNEVQSTILGMPTTDPYIITGPYIVNVTTTTLTLAWRTPIPMDSRIEYSCASGCPFTSLVVDTPTQATTDHYIRIANLVSNKIYQYTVTCTGGNPAQTLITTGTVRLR